MSSDSEDDYAEYGTPLDPIDEDAVVRKKPFLLEDQVARDKHGRRRFHGAFTGGFSAGFLNTVGSLEGWKPVAFKSSRSEKQEVKMQKPQDYMDEEDVSEFGIAPTILQASADFSVSAPNKRRMPDFHTGTIPGTPVLHDLLQPARQTAAVRLLMDMGWKPGQGVGPRVTRHEKQKQREKVKVYGCAMPGGEESGGDSGEDSGGEMEGVTFAPENYEAFPCQPKNDCFGLGYSGLSRKSVLGSSNISTSLKLNEKSRRVNIMGQAFGVGALEDEDEDIYSREDMSQYDTCLGDEVEDRRARGGRKRFDNDVLEGFVRAESKASKKYFAPPQLPRGFEPRHVVLAAPPTGTVGPVRDRRDLGRHALNSQIRAVIIGDSLVPTENTSAETAAVQSEARKITAALLAECPIKTENEVYKPFSLDPDKQRRYQQYLQLCKMGEKERLVDLQPVTLSTWEREREKSEFEQAARLFTPLSGVMADRFTRGKTNEDLSPLAVVEKMKHGKEEQRNAAKMKMFGKLTREESEWGPCSLLCKRFNIPEPGTVVPMAVKKPSRFSIFDCLDSLHAKTEAVPEMEQITPPEAVPPEAAPPEPDTPTETFTEPEVTIDLFKAIFLDSDEEETEKPLEEIQNPKRNLSPARGIFENLDLEALNVKIEVQEVDTVEESVVEESVVEESVAEESVVEESVVEESVVEVVEEESYGPKIPQELLHRLSCAEKNERMRCQEPSETVVESDESEIRERHGKKKKKHKHKSTKHKSKHKKHKR